MKKVGILFITLIALFMTAIWLAFRDLEEQYKHLD